MNVMAKLLEERKRKGNLPLDEMNLINKRSRRHYAFSPDAFISSRRLYIRNSGAGEGSGKQQHCD
jgi:hypothetical protein